MAINIEQKSLINELTQGKELANQLRKHLDPCSSSNQTRQFLVEKILSTYEKSLSLINNDHFRAAAIRKRGSLNDNCSPGSESSDQENSNYNYCHKDLYKKRKTMPRWTEHVRVSKGSGLESSLDDGYSWRKYGQKDILGANFPRGYYRCTHRHTKGCLATKQVQRTDEDPTILEVTYRGSHNCSSTIVKSSSIAQLPSVINSDSINQFREPFLKFGTETDKKDEIFSSFTFPCAAAAGPTQSDYIGDLILDQKIFATPDENTEFDNCFFMSDFGVRNGLSPQSDYTGETFSTPTSVTNSPIGDLDLSMIKVEFDPNFAFDNLEFFN